MWELERESTSSADTPVRARLALIGQGRLGTAIAAALEAHASDIALIGPLGRDHDIAALASEAVLLCVPDAQIAPVAATLPRGPLVGHCSGATGLEALAPHDAFVLHPLMTVTAQGARFTGAGAAVAGTSPRALAFAERLASTLELNPVRLREEDRAAYHAAASVASNFLVTLEAMAEQIAATAGVERELLVPLVRATVENWAALGPEQALTGPVARGDEVTVQRQRAAIAERTPALLAAFDALVDATRELAARPSKVRAA